MKKFLYLVMFILIFLSCRNSNANSRQIDLREIIKYSGRIFSGRCIDVKKGFHPEYKNIKVTLITFETFEMLKGDAESEVTFMKFGHGREMPHSKINHKKGTEAFMFLYPESRVGFTSPVGGKQGRVIIKTDPVSGERSVLKNYLSSNWDKDNPRTQIDQNAVKDNIKKFLSYNDFTQLIKRIVDEENTEEEEK